MATDTFILALKGLNSNNPGQRPGLKYRTPHPTLPRLKIFSAGELAIPQCGIVGSGGGIHKYYGYFATIYIKILKYA